MTSPSKNGSKTPRLPQNRTEEAKASLRKLAAEMDRQSDFALGQHLGLNSAHIHKLWALDYLSPTLDRRLVELGYMDPLPEPVPVYPCECGEVHTLKSCPLNKRKRAPRLSISLVDMNLAAGSIIRNMTPEQVRDLVQLLEEK